jgi:hemerythrin-like metal-binding protein
MATLIWNHSCTVGVPSMDDQHGILLDALNELRMALLHGAENQTVRPMLARVSNMMRLHNFPGLAAHRAEHQRLLGRLAQFDARYEQRHAGNVYELVEYLRKWFTTHTGVAGQKYGPWLQKCGVQ